jgi:hypothetical protein
MAIFPQSTSRRRFLRQLGAATAASAFAFRARAVTPRCTVGETRVISHEPQFYHGWPTLARRKTGELHLVWSGGREGHICPFGRVEMMISRDDGARWLWPQTLLDGPSDDRDVMETARGTARATFTSLAHERPSSAREKAGHVARQLQRWRLAHERLSARAKPSSAK